MKTRLITTVLQYNGKKMIDFCQDNGIQPSQLYALKKEGILPEIKKQLKKEVKKAEPKILEDLEMLKSLK